MPNISEVICMDLSKIMPERTNKYCVCISAGDGKYFIINSNSREMYDDFKIEACDYDFLSHDSYVSCHKAYVLGDELIVKKLGDLNYDDMLKILNKIRNSKRIAEVERDDIALELEKWLSNYAANKLSGNFGKR